MMFLSCFPVDIKNLRGGEGRGRLEGRWSRERTRKEKRRMRGRLISLWEGGEESRAEQSRAEQSRGVASRSDCSELKGVQLFDQRGTVWIASALTVHRKRIGPMLLHRNENIQKQLVPGNELERNNEEKREKMKRGAALRTSNQIK